jgi:amino acid adenylation domain-containing protein
MLAELLSDATSRVEQVVYKFESVDELQLRSAMSEALTLYPSCSAVLSEDGTLDSTWDQNAILTCCNVHSESKVTEFSKRDRQKGFGVGDRLLRVTLLRLGKNILFLVVTFHQSLFKVSDVEDVLRTIFSLYEKRDLELHLRVGAFEDCCGAQATNADAPSSHRLPLPRPSHSLSEEQDMEVPFSLTLDKSTLESLPDVSSATIMYAAWALVLSRYLDMDKVTISLSLPLDSIYTCPTQLEVTFNPKQTILQLLQGIEGQLLAMSKAHKGHAGSRQQQHFGMIYRKKLHPTLAEELSWCPFVACPIVLAITESYASVKVELFLDSSTYSAEYFAPTLGYLDCVLQQMSFLETETLLSTLHVVPNPTRPVLKEQMPNHSLFQMFANMASLYPQNTALEHCEASLTYLELFRLSCQLSALLSSQSDLQPETRVGILSCRSMHMVIGLLSILNLGGCCVMLDATLPLNRLNVIIEEAQIQVILYANEFLHILETFDRKLVRVEIPLALSTSALPVAHQPFCKFNDKCIIVFTSGSTGKPKGILMTQRGIVNLIHYGMKLLQMKPSDRVAQFMSIGFDGAIFELFVSLCSGATLVIKDEASIKMLKTVDVCLISPSFLALLDPNDFRNFRTVVVGGEQINASLVDKWIRHTRIINAYGPAENSIISNTFVIKDKEHLYIGPCVPNTFSFILNSSKQMVPFGVPGELYIGGVGISSEYINNSQKTREAFVQNPFFPGILYRTGDIVRLHPDGNYEFVGRQDQQIKHLGFRIELGELEVAMTQCFPCIQDVAVLYHRCQIVAFYTSGTNILEEEVKDILASKLPHYMLPSKVIQIDEFQITHNGKKDRKRLLERLESIDPAVKVDAIGTIGAVREEVNERWKKYLPNSEPDSSFFEGGGNSILATLFTQELRASLQQPNLPINLIYKYPHKDQFCAQVYTFMTQSQSAEEVADAQSSAMEDTKNIVRDIQHNLTFPPPPRGQLEVNRVLLTGATGFIGIFLLNTLLTLNPHAHVICVVRERSDADSLVKLKRAFARRFKWQDDFDSRLTCLNGDLRRKRLGLSERVWTSLATSVDIVIHNGAEVSLMTKQLRVLIFF